MHILEFNSNIHTEFGNLLNTNSRQDYMNVILVTRYQLISTVEVLHVLWLCLLHTLIKGKFSFQLHLLFQQKRFNKVGIIGPQVDLLKLYKWFLPVV